MLMQADGTLTENQDGFSTAYEKEVKTNKRFHVFVAEKDGDTKYVFPVYGTGLWGAIWGYVALNSDKILSMEFISHMRVKRLDLVQKLQQNTFRLFSLARRL